MSEAEEVPSLSEDASLGDLSSDSDDEELLSGDEEDFSDDDDSDIEEAAVLSPKLKKTGRTLVARAASMRNLSAMMSTVDEGDEELNVQCRIILRQMVAQRMMSTRLETGELSVVEIQGLLMQQKDEASQMDWVSEIQELKHQLIKELKKNHVLEGQVNKLDKRIALLIKNRGVLEFDDDKKKKKKKKKKKGEEEESESSIAARTLLKDRRKPIYMARVIYMMDEEQMETIVNMIILTLYGDAFSPREEFLLLRLFKLSIHQELAQVEKLNELLKATSVVPAMIIAYNKRKYAVEYIKATFATFMKNFIESNVNLELSPKRIYIEMINEEEVETGQSSSLDRKLPLDKILELKAVQEKIRERRDKVCALCQNFLDCMLHTLKKLPYGMRYIAKILAEYAHDNFPSTTEGDIVKMCTYFVFFRFINLAIITPEAFDLAKEDLSMTTRKNLLVISKVLQNLFNLRVFLPKDKDMLVTNSWIEANFHTVKQYVRDLLVVPEPEDFLQVDQYVALTQRTKPIIIVSLQELSALHNLLSTLLDNLIPPSKKEDPLRLIMKDLGDAPPEIEDSDNREVQLTLESRFARDVAELSPTEELLLSAKELAIGILRGVPANEKDSDDLENLLGRIASTAQLEGMTDLEQRVKLLFKQMQQLIEADVFKKETAFEEFKRMIALEVTNRAEVRERQRNEVKRLTSTLRNLRKHQSYLQDQIKDYNMYLNSVRDHQSLGGTKKQRKKEKKKKQSGIKFTYKELEKAGIIVDSEVPQMSRKKTKFVLTNPETGMFEIEAKVAGIHADTATLEFDDLLERNYNGIEHLDLPQVTLNVNMTIHLINKHFNK